MNEVENYVILTLTAVGLAITSICLIIQQRRYNQQKNYEVIAHTENSESHNDLTSQSTMCYGVRRDIEDICCQSTETNTYNSLCDSNRGCSIEQQKICNVLTQNYEDSNINNVETQILDENGNDIHDISHHIVFILFLSIAMVVNLGICTWALVMKQSTGIFIELQFLDILLIYGQGIIIFCIFELDVKFIVCFCIKMYRQCRYGSDNFVLPDLQDLQEATHNICQQFANYHQERSKEHLQLNRNQCNNSELLFPGKQFVDCLMMFGLAQNRTEAEQYGKHLLLGRIIQHVKNKCDFHDNMYMYKFC